MGAGDSSDAFKDADIDSQYSAIVLKRGDGLPDRSISNERRIHRQILSAVQMHGNNPLFFRVNIPSAIDHLPPQSDKWKTILPRLLTEFVACEALVSERILPMPRETRRLLVQRFWNGDIDSVVNDKRNEHCLVRPYLGRRRQGARQSRLQSISLRNYPLYADQIEELGLPIDEIDANDVEFVLARPLTSLTTGILGSHAMWLLDFDYCKELDMNETGVKVAVQRFWRNDPFYPNPNCKCPEDERLWALFKDRFLGSSRAILEGECEAIRELPELLMARIVETIGVYYKGS
ncbi:zinc finger protein-domain-containing protein [Lasiosphaeria miniovina]|uniref:Zinc finger protein-domain-containing protein n=1 Tax=Lasiosphaeria miniovina TaxID=1954250 RepID=A0AA40B4I4_9PEZI|nr:zinc finger protein-domain-containing protein [Lasiosphaeria miniovina]KAK0727555.1 zinc finger protein-domain-containing protein [Lasiosphaeria miniovina]